MRARTGKLDHAFDQRAQFHFVVLQGEGAGLDLGEIQDVADQREQRFARLADRLDIGALLGAQIGFEQQPGHAEHAVHRGADLMAHRGQKAGLGAAGGFGLVARDSSSRLPAPCAR